MEENLLIFYWSRNESYIERGVENRKSISNRGKTLTNSKVIRIFNIPHLAIITLFLFTRQ